MGPSATTPGLHYAFGFNGEGFAIGPGVGEVMAELRDRRDHDADRTVLYCALHTSHRRARQAA